MRKNILKFSLFFLSFVVAFFAWLSLNNAILIPNSSVWLVPMIWFSLFYIVYSLEFILISEKLLINLSIVLGIFLSLIFVHTIWHIAFLLLAIGLFIVSSRQIKNDLGQNVKLYLPKTLRMGKVFFIFALTLAISSQYYFQAKAVGLLKLPVFDVGAILENSLARNILYKLNPDLQKLNDKNLTVDQMILQNYQASQIVDEKTELLKLAQGNQIILSIDLQKIEELQKQKILEAGREQLGKMANQTLTGSERVTDVFTKIVNQKIQNLISPDYASENFPTIPIYMAIVLFLTVLSLGVFLSRILVYLISFIFWIFILTKIIEIQKVTAEMEVIK